MKEKNSLLEQFKNFLDSQEGQEFIEKFKNERQQENKRIERVKNFFKKAGRLQALLPRLIAEHNDEYRGKWYAKGYEPNLTHKMQLVFDCAMSKGKRVKNNFIHEDLSFSTDVSRFKQYYFAITYGQGCFYSIYDANTKELIFRW